MKVLNAFSLNMLATLPAAPRFSELTLEQVKDLLASGLESAVGHADTAAVFEDVLGLPVPAVRSTLLLSPGDSAVIGQYRGPRLPEGAHQLPEGATIQWILLEL